MTPINAVAKVRFSSAKPQRVHLVQDAPVTADLLCLEAQQELAIAAGMGILYVVTGTATLIGPSLRTALGPGQLVAPAEDCTLANISEQRLVCLAFRAP